MKNRLMLTVFCLMGVFSSLSGDESAALTKSASKKVIEQTNKKCNCGKKKT